MSLAWRPRRHRGAGVTGLEVWNLELPDGRAFWEAAGAPRIEALERQGCSPIEIGTDLAGAIAAALGVLHEQTRFETAFVGGGLLLQPGLAEALRRRYPSGDLVLDGDGPFVGEAGGRALLGDHAETGLVVDVGQTAVKASRGGLRRTWLRDLERLPRRLIGDPRGPEPPEQRRAELAQLVAAAAELLCAPPAGPAPVVLALPCPVDDRLVPGPGTYGIEGDAELVPAILEAFGRVLDTAGVGAPRGDGTPDALVLNDAELAAESARARLRPRARALCVTLGFGPGAALLDLDRD